MFKTKNKNLLGFTLIEMMISLFLSVMVAFFVYTMMISSYNAYNRLSSLSKNANSIRFFISSINNSAMYAWNFENTTTELRFYRYDKHHRKEVMDKYFFEGGGTLVNDGTRSTTVAGINGAAYNSNLRTLFVKEVWIGGKIYERVVVSNIIRGIYFSVSGPNKYRRLNLGVIYDDVVNAKQSESTGQIISASEMNDVNTTINRRLFCFAIRG